jgi:hypothetical protein
MVPNGCWTVAEWPLLPLTTRPSPLLPWDQKQLCESLGFAFREYSVEIDGHGQSPVDTNVHLLE